MATHRKISRIPPVKVAKNAAQGLQLHDEFNRGGTIVGVKRAQQLQKRIELTEEDIKHIYSYFKRHAVDKEGADFNNKTAPSNGFIAWQLWGGDAGFEWIQKLHEALEE